MVIIDGKKLSPSKKIIDDLKLQIIYMPLESKLGYNYHPIVHQGDYVCIGETIAQNKVADLYLKSSVSGTVVGIRKKYISNGTLVDCIAIENDFKEKYLNKPGKIRKLANYNKDEFITMLKEYGISGLGGSDYPTYLKYSVDSKIHYLVVNGAECEVYSSSDNALMYEYTEEILEAIDAIMEIMNIPKAYIAINENNNKIIKQFLKYINTYPNIKVYPLPDGYPNGWERNIVSEIFGMTYEKDPMELGILVNNVATIYSIYEMLKYKRPLTNRIVTIAGEGIKRPANYKLKIGSNFSEIMLKTGDLVKLKNPIIIAGGALMGKSIPSEELIVTRDLSTILVLNNKEEEVNPCIKCGKCSEVCPVGLMPSLIVNEDKKKKVKYLDKCLECGLCSYVCPSKIEVREKVIEFKEKKNDRVSSSK